MFDLGTRFGRILVLAAIAAGGVSTAQAGGLKDGVVDYSDEAKAWVLFSGFDVVRDAQYTYSGLIVALNRDIGKDGFVLRLYGGNVGYEYDNGGIRTDGDGWQFDAMLGYKVSRGHWWAAAYAGVDYQNHDLTPDDLDNPVRGSEVGVKVAFDSATLRTGTPVYASLSGNYSTAFDSYWARGRVGANLGHLTIGPEAIVIGNEAFDAHRLGGFATFDMRLSRTTSFEVTLSGGYQFLDESGSGFASGQSIGSGGGEGVYGGVSISSVF